MANFQDPWAKHHAWRNHALFTRRARIGTMFPGLGIATVAFAAYLGYEYVTAPKETHHHGHSAEGHEWIAAESSNRPRAKVEINETGRTRWPSCEITF
ncbi:hypothetical protein EC991_005694 [Linnemannia zychae]|nr:hypothetical protein EC991_005694 [Linnemannia zychae]